MRALFIFAVAVFYSFCPLQAQSDGIPKYKDFPIVFSIQFHSMSMPFRNLASMFSNVGFGLGTEFSYGSDQTWTQQFSLIWYRNREVGNGLLINTQIAWRTEIANQFYGEVKGGAGYLYSFRPVVSFAQKQGKWESVGHRGKGMLALPIGVGLGYRLFDQQQIWSPFAGYQFYLAKGYNTSLPVVPGSFLQFGTRFHP